MTASVRVLAMAGSTRSDSYNKRLARLAAVVAAAVGAETRVVDLRDFQLPLFDEDLERDQGAPENARALKALFVESDGLLIASPEYNSSFSGVLKNAIDWVSRPYPGEPPLVAFKGKVAAILSASPGQLGGLRGLVHLRSVLGNLGVLVLPDQLAIPRSFEAFAPDGSLADPKQNAAVADIGRALATTAAKLKG